MSMHSILTSKLFYTISFCFFLLLGHSGLQAQNPAAKSRTPPAPTPNSIQTSKPVSGLNVNALQNSQEARAKKEAAAQFSTQEEAAKEQSGGDGRVSSVEASVLNRFNKFREQMEK